VFLGSAFLGFEQSADISEQFGTPLMVLFVAISVLMLYTLLISIFSQTFSEASHIANQYGDEEQDETLYPNKTDIGLLV